LKATKEEWKKAEKMINFADDIIAVENIGKDKSLYGMKGSYDRLRITYIYNGRKQRSTVSGRWGYHKK